MENSSKIADKLIYSSAGKIESIFLNSINPTNSTKEKEEFFSAQDRFDYYEPKYKYLPEVDFSEQKNQLAKALQLLESNGITEKILKNKAEQILSEIALVENRNTKKFSNSSKKSYKKPTAKNIKTANEILARPIKPTENKLTPAELKKQLEEKLSKAKMTYTIVLSNQMSAKASVHPSERKIKLNENAKFEDCAAERLFVHEVETHIYRNLNGLSQPIKSLALGFGGENLETEEGLAAFNETKASVSSEQQMRTYAGRLIAVDYALKHNFSETYDYLKTFFDNEEAYTITQRVKRGVPYGEKGAFTKDHCYLSGLIKLQEYYEKEKPILDLYIGKISIQEAKYAKKLPCIVEPTYLPRWLLK